MRRVFYQMLRYFGPWITAVAAAVISAGYFVFLPRRTAASVRFYRAVFPDRSLFFHLLCTWRQYQSFARVFSERLELQQEGRISYESEGWEHLEDVARAGTGGVILMSHLGSWEVAARLFRKRRLRMMLYMGRKQDEEVEGIQKEDMVEDDLNVVAVTEGGGSPFDMLKGLRFLKEGGFVSLTGDQLWNPDRRVTVPFAGRRVHLPDTPYLLAAIAGVPLFVFFSFRTSRRRYRIEITSPIHLRRVPRRERSTVISEAAATYAALLEAAVRRHPDQWYHFDQFVE